MADYFLRFPYNKALGAGIGPEATKRGYVFVSQDTRGRYASEGENLPFDADGHADGKWDGYDSAEWIAEQEWCNGKIGTWGGSAGAITQYFLAGTGQTNIVSQHLTVGNASLFKDCGLSRGDLSQGAGRGLARVNESLRPTRWIVGRPTIPTRNTGRTERSRSNSATSMRRAFISAAGSIYLLKPRWMRFWAIKTKADPVHAAKQKLIMGPWTHGVLQARRVNSRFPGANTTPDNLHDSWKWFAATLNGEANGILEAPAVTYYVMGASGENGAPGNEWRTADQWPPTGGRKSKLSLLPGSSVVAGPTATIGNAFFKSDPENPVPSVGGYELTIPAGPKDRQRSIESREDVLVFTAEPLPRPFEVAGNVIARISLQSDAPDTDLIVRLCDVYPDGRSFNICEGTQRLSLSKGLEKQLWHAADEPVEIEIKLWPTSMIFNKGHRLRVHVASSSSPALEPNLQNGKPPHTGEPVTATDRIWFGPEHSSYLMLPVFEPAQDQ